MSNVLDSVKITGGYGFSELRKLRRDQRKLILDRAREERGDPASRLSRISHRSQKLEAELGPFLRVHDGIAELKDKCEGREANFVDSQRGVITSCSSRSRKNLCLAIVDWAADPNAFTTGTFADDVFEEMDQLGRRDKSNQVLDRFQKRVVRRFPGAAGFWRREWKYRKYGLLKGRLVPHFHFMWHFPGLTEEESFEFLVQIQRMWVECTGSKHPDAMRVALESKENGDRAFEYLKGKTHVGRYISKYMSKPDNTRGEEVVMSLGRSWGRMGRKTDMAQKRVFNTPVSPVEAKVIKRLLRRYEDSKARMYRAARCGKSDAFNEARRGMHFINIKNWSTYVWIDQKTLLDMVWFAHRQEESLKACPF